MRAQVLHRATELLRLEDVPLPEPGQGQVRLKVRACAVCRTDLHIVDGELNRPKLPLVLGHEIVATVASGTATLKEGARVGVPWLASWCGVCDCCRRGNENLCDRARFTGYDVDGGYAELAVADERACYPLPEAFPDDAAAAPLLCAGLIGYRTLKFAG